MDTDTVAVGAHFGFGAAAGALFSVVTHPVPAGLPKVVAGVGYGLGVWVASYAGWVPALRIMPPLAKDLPDRRRGMAAAHVVYGAVLGAAAGRRRY